MEPTASGERGTRSRRWLVLGILAAVVLALLAGAAAYFLVDEGPVQDDDLRDVRPAVPDRADVPTLVEEGRVDLAGSQVGEPVPS